MSDPSLPVVPKAAEAVLAPAAPHSESAAVKPDSGAAAMEVTKVDPAPRLPGSRDPVTIPLRKLSVNLIKTYKNINEVCRHAKKFTHVAGVLREKTGTCKTKCPQWRL